jgi:hypothetical protein
MAVPGDDDFSRRDLLEQLRHLQQQVGLLALGSYEQLVEGEAPADGGAHPLDLQDWAAIAAASDKLAADLETLIAELDGK